MVRYNEEIEINGEKLTRKYVESLNKEERIELIEPIFHYFRINGFQYPDDEAKLKKEYKRLCDKEVDVESKEAFNNGSIATYICKYFCRTFYQTTEVGKKNMVELFDDDEVLKKVIANRLGLDWYKQRGEDDIEAFQISFRQIIQGYRSSRQVAMVSMFKPDIAKWIYSKYTNPNDLVYDPSAGFGGRMLGAMSCGRRYIGVDPLTIPELNRMKEYFGFECDLYNGCSEDFRLEENSVDFTFTSPPYFNQEQYSRDERQAYNKGEDYFYNVYWKNTLENIKYMLKPNKYFALNVKNYPKMVEMADKSFKQVDELKLRTVRSHLNKKAGIEKYEPVHIFKNLP